jgi:hypothetical protein
MPKGCHSPSSHRPTSQPMSTRITSVAIADLGGAQTNAKAARSTKPKFPLPAHAHHVNLINQGRGQSRGQRKRHDRIGINRTGRRRFPPLRFATNSSPDRRLTCRLSRHSTRDPREVKSKGNRGAEPRLPVIWGDVVQLSSSLYGDPRIHGQSSDTFSLPRLRPWGV